MEKTSQDLTNKLNKAKLYKEEGINLFKKQKFEEALSKFQTAYKDIETNVESTREAKDIGLSLLLNMSNCYNNLKKYDLCKEKANEAIRLRDDNPKAYYYRGLAYAYLDHFDKAELDYKNLCGLVPPSDPGVGYLREIIDKLTSEKAKRETSLFKNSFRKGKLYEEKQVEKPNLEKPIEDKEDKEDKSTAVDNMMRDMFSRSDNGEPMTFTDIPEAINPRNPKVYMDVTIGDREPKRFEIELFLDKFPKSVLNFKNLLLGKAKNGMTYKGCTFHKLNKGISLEGGDIDGNGGSSIYGRIYKGEKTRYRHTYAGLVSLTSLEPNVFSSLFNITFVPLPTEMDEKNLVIGRIISGCLDDLSGIGDEHGVPSEIVRIVDAGEIKKN
jgi:peptidylprolyl isomerase